jgi:hypothetical protein
MKTSLYALAVCAFALAVFVPAPAPAQQPENPAKDAEKLPEYPKLDPKNTVTALNPEKTIFGEVAVVGDKKKVVRVGLACEVCLRVGPLEEFMCKRGTKEHESIVRIDADVRMIHLALVAAGAEKGTPTQFIDPKTEQPKYKPATGTKINVIVHYTRDGKKYTHPAQEWVIDRDKTKKDKKDVILPSGWVFAGSIEIKDPCDPMKTPFYAANSGDVIAISNFPYSMLEMPIEISKDDDSLLYEARTEKIPPLFSKVWVILEVAGK